MGASDGYVVGKTKVVDHGSDSLRWNLVIVGDGYKATELTKFHNDVQSFINALRNTPPFNELFCGINIYRVDVVSTDSGADDPGCAGGAATTAKTFFDATFCTNFGGTPLDRLLTVDAGAAISTANAQVPLKHQVLCIVNSAKYGGSGGAIAVCSTNSQAREIAIHEMGHSAFGLADEYEDGGGVGTPPGEPAEPNVTRNTNRASNKWRNLILPSTPMPTRCNSACTTSTCVTPATPAAPGVVGTYEGAAYTVCNVYRPTPACYMRDYSPFCPVCSQVIRQVLNPFLPAESIMLITPSIDFHNVPAGLGGVGVTTHRAIVWEVVTCRSLTFTIDSGPTGGFGVPIATSVTVTSDPILPVGFARLWLSYTSTNPGDSAAGSVTVRCVETGQVWLINIVANTIARPKSAVSLVLDRSGSMNDDAGDGISKIQKLRESAGTFVSLMQDNDGIGIVRFNASAQRIMDIQSLPGAQGVVDTTLNGTMLTPSGQTSIGDGVVKSKQMLDDAQAIAAPPYDVTASVVLTDGVWNRPPSLATIGSSITANTFAIGLGLPSNISVDALAALCQGHQGFLLITGAITSDQSMRLSKYFLQVLAGITNAQIASDPRGILVREAEHRIPFYITEADYGMDLIVLSTEPAAIDFQIESPDGQLITPGAPGGNYKYRLSKQAAVYRSALPVLPGSPEGSHAGLWTAILRLKPNETRQRYLPYEFVAHSYSSLQFNANIQQSSFKPGTVAQLDATLFEYDVPRTGKVWAEVTHPDRALTNTVLSMTSTGKFETDYPLRLPGVYQFRIRARGETISGFAFERERTLTAAVQAEPPLDNDKNRRPRSSVN